MLDGFQIVRTFLQAIIQIAEPQHDVVIIDVVHLARIERIRQKQQPGVDAAKVLVAPLVLVRVRGQMRIDEANGRVVKFERDGDAALVTHSSHETRADGLSVNVGDESAQRLLDVDEEHHADEADALYALVLGARMQTLLHGVRPLRFSRRVREEERLLAEIQFLKADGVEIGWNGFGGEPRCEGLRNCLTVYIPRP